MEVQATAAEPEWGFSTDLSDSERANLGAFEGVFPHWNNRDISKMLTYYDENIVWRNVAVGETYRGREEVRQFLEHLFGALPDLSLDVTLRVPRGKYVAEEYVIRGHHRAPLFGIPATGKFLEIPAMSMVEMRNGRLLEDHFYFDVATVLRQMGIMPSLQSAQTVWGRTALSIFVNRTQLASIAAAAVGGLLVLRRSRGPR